MATSWNIIIAQGSEYQVQVTVTSWPSSFPALSTATDWTLRLAQAGSTPFLTATTANYITLNVAKTVGTIKIPGTVTSAMPTGQALFDLEITFPGSPSVIKRIVSLGDALVNTYAGST